MGCPAGQRTMPIVAVCAVRGRTAPQARQARSASGFKVWQLGHSVTYASLSRLKVNPGRPAFPHAWNDPDAPDRDVVLAGRRKGRREKVLADLLRRPRPLKDLSDPLVRESSVQAIRGN